MREHIDKIREAFPRFEWKQYGNFLVARTEGWILSVDMAFPEHGHLASFSETSSTVRLHPHHAPAAPRLSVHRERVRHGLASHVD